MEASMDKELTGCDCFSYFVVGTNKDSYSLIYPKEPNNNSSNFAYLAHDDGASEQIANISIRADTLLVKIEAGYQEGSGEYRFKIYKSERWTFIITDRKEFPE